MSSSEQFSGRANFVNTCNLLSRFIRKKGRRLRDFNIEIDGKIECLESIMKSGCNIPTPTRNLLNNMEKSARPSNIEAEDNSNVNAAASREAVPMEPKSDQLTIFYAGRVLVFDNCPPEKAQELVIFFEKGKGCSGSATANVLPEITHSGGAAAVKSGKLSFLDVSGGKQSRSDAVGLENGIGTLPNACKEMWKRGSGDEDSARPSPLAGDAGADLPIARRASVHRFLEKRKERSTLAKGAPHEIQPCSSSSDQLLDLNL